MPYAVLFPSPSIEKLDFTIERFFRETAPVHPDDGVVVAFSGGPDSTALLFGMARMRRPHTPRLIAAHLDHGLDPGSAARADRAIALAERIGIPVVSEHRPVEPRRRPGESLEAAARRVRYAFLEEVRLAEGARWIATAHQRDDQAETVVLRLLYGTGIDGLAGIRPVRGVLVRPLLALPRRALAEAVRAADLAPQDDPTNRDPFAARNRVRHALLPTLPAEVDGDSLARLAQAAAGARRRLETIFETQLAPEPLRTSVPAGPGIALDPGSLCRLPEVLLPHALAFLHRKAGAPYPAGAAARTELVRQLRQSGLATAKGPTEGKRGIGCDVGGGWRWRYRDGRLELRPPGEAAAPRLPMEGLSYTLSLPGEVEIAELGVRVRIDREAAAPWMFRGSRRRAALGLAHASGGSGPQGGAPELVIRTRRPGDRIHPLGAPGERKLKDVLIDRRIPRDRRDRLPLLCVGERIAWVPGVTVDDRFRVARGARAAWVAEVVPCQPNESNQQNESSRSSNPTRSSARSSTSADG